MKITLGISPCPNDTFIFDALVNGKIDAGGIAFDVVLADVEQLNQWALEGKLDITKISYGVVPMVAPHYRLLSAGGALGMGVGPLLISKNRTDLPDVAAARVAIPGEHTTAHRLFNMAYPNARYKTFMIFSEIEEAVLNGEMDYGVIIHENRFTYQQKGLIQVADLGTLWEEKTGFPIPLGCIAVNKAIPSARAEQINQLIRESILYAKKHYPLISDYVINHAQEMDESVMRNHINLYVNDYSLTLGETGKNAVLHFLGANTLPADLFIS